LVLAVPPASVFVVEGAGFEASVEDADEAAGESSRGVVAAVSGGTLLVVEGVGARGGAQCGEGLGVEGVDEPVVVHEPGRDDFP
jgi:hypothetical protein